MSTTDSTDTDNSNGITTIDVRNAHRIPQAGGSAVAGDLDTSEATEILEDSDNYRRITTKDHGEPGEETAVDVETVMDIIDNDTWLRVWATFVDGVQYINLYNPESDNPTNVSVELNPDEVRYQLDLPTPVSSDD